MDDIVLGLDVTDFSIVVIGALIAGFTTGFAGFGTGLVVAGFWFTALPAHMVPPLIVIAAMSAQVVGLFTQRPAMSWRRVGTFAIPGCLAVPIGIYALTQSSPLTLRLAVGVFLVAYAVFQFSGMGQRRTKAGRLPAADAVVGAAGGFLGGYAGLSGPVPMIWLQMCGGPVQDQLAVYRPYSLIVLTLASCGMAIGGQIDTTVLQMALLCTPFTLLGARIGSRLGIVIDEHLFRQVVLALLLASGVALMIQSLPRMN